MSWLLEGIEDASFARRFIEHGEPWLCSLKECPQDRIYHAEGDVLTHTLMVCEELSRLDAFNSLNDTDKQILAWSALLHDCAKPACTLTDDEGRIHSPGHAAKGALQARRLLWARDCPFEVREEIVGLVHYHMRVMWALEDEDPARLIRKISLRCRPELLGILAEADMRGRICPDLEDLLHRVELFRLLAKEHDCYHRPARFASELGRFRYLQNRWHDPDSAPYDDTRSEVILLSGLPGAGKDTWIAENGRGLPVVSLDGIRRELGVGPRENQAKVAQVARERAREYLRTGSNFIWNATNLSRMIRTKSLSLFHEYKAKVRIVYLEASPKELERRNREREHPVPWSAIEKMIQRWDVPQLSEACSVVYSDPKL